MATAAFARLFPFFFFFFVMCVLSFVEKQTKKKVPGHKSTCVRTKEAVIGA